MSVEESIQIKGGSIRSKLEMVRDRFGEPAAEDLERILKDAGAYPVLEANWYPFELFDRILVRIADKHFGSDLSRLKNVGRYSAQKALTGVYKGLKKMDFSDFARRRLTVLHSRYYSGGKLAVVQVADKGCRLCLSAPVHFESDIWVACGFYEGAAEFGGHTGARCVWERRGDLVLYTITWPT